MKVYLQVPLSSYSGYGNDGIGITEAFMRLGADVHLAPTHIQPPISAEILSLMTKTAVAPFDLVISHVDPGVLSVNAGTSQGSLVTVGWTMWESSTFANVPGTDKELSENYENFDVLVGYDKITSSNLEKYFDGPVITVQGGFDPEEWVYYDRDWHSEDFYFSMIGVLSPRKNPFLAIQAFSELRAEHKDFEKHARLMLKTTAPGLHSKMEDVYPGLRIFYDMWDTDTVKEFYRNTHVLLAPSLGEGKNMPCLEFMSTGGPVIATNWGGMAEWLDPAFSYPLNDYTMGPAVPISPGAEQAYVNVEDLKTQMLRVFRNRNEAREKGYQASQIIPQIRSWDSVIDRLMLQLKDAAPNGSELYSKYKMLDRGGRRDDA